MNMANSARAHCVLGATLILVTAPNVVFAGIEAGNVTGIEAGNVLGIEGGNVTGIEAGNVLIGPVDSIDSLNGLFDAMGQSVMASTDLLNQLSIGDLVSVEGSIVGPGLLYADSVTVSSEQYVAGATEVFVTGILSSIDASTGTATLGALRVDYTSSLSSGRAPSGVVWSFRGTQPGIRGVMISDRVQAY